MSELEFADLIPPNHWFRGLPCSKEALTTLGPEVIDDLIAEWQWEHVVGDDPRVRQLQAIRDELIRPRLSVLRGKNDFDAGTRVCFYVTDPFELNDESPRWYDATIDVCSYFSDGASQVECLLDLPTPRQRDGHKKARIIVVDQDPRLLLPRDRAYLSAHPEYAALWVLAVDSEFRNPDCYDPGQLLEALLASP